jgi:hypothetical protein
MTTDERRQEGTHENASTLSEEMLAALRHRVATRFYEQPRVVEAVARSLAAHTPFRG